MAHSSATGASCISSLSLSSPPPPGRIFFRWPYEYIINNFCDALTALNTIFEINFDDGSISCAQPTISKRSKRFLFFTLIILKQSSSSVNIGNVYAHGWRYVTMRQ